MFESKINRGRANGYAPLDGDGKVPLSKLPPIQSTIDTGSLVTMRQTGSFATTGSNLFYGTQTISGSISLLDGRLITDGTSSKTAHHWINYPNTTNNWFIRLYSDNGSNLKARMGLENLSDITIETTGNSNGLGNAGPDYKWKFDNSGSLTSPGNINVSGSVYVSSSLVVASSVVSNGTIDALNSDLIIDGGYLILTGSVLPVGPTGSAGDREGMVVFDKNFLYYCTNNYDPYIAPTAGVPGFSVTASGATHTYNPDGSDWNGYHVVGSDAFLQTGASQEGDGSIPPVAGWYFVDDNGNIRQLLNTPVWFSGGQPSPFPNGGGWLCVVDSNDWVYSDSNPELVFHEQIPTVNFAGGVAPSTGSLGSGEIWTKTKLNKTPNYAPFGSGSWNSQAIGEVTELDITKDIHLIDITDKGDNSHFYLPNGIYDGQVVRFTLKGNNTNGPNSVYIWMDNLRTYNGETQSSTTWSPFYCGEGQGPCRSLATAVYIDGAWNIDTDWWDM